MSETMRQESLYQVKDLALATTISLFQPIEAIDRPDGSRKAIFLFVRSPELDELVEQYWKGLLKVEPQQYFNQLKVIKARLWSEE
jgi:hypothetical protein